MPDYQVSVVGGGGGGGGGGLNIKGYTVSDINLACCLGGGGERVWFGGTFFH